MTNAQMIEAVRAHVAEQTRSAAIADYLQMAAWYGENAEHYAKWSDSDRAGLNAYLAASSYFKAEALRDAGASAAPPIDKNGAMTNGKPYKGDAATTASTTAVRKT